MKESRSRSHGGKRAGKGGYLDFVHEVMEDRWTLEESESQLDRHWRTPEGQVDSEEEEMEDEQEDREEQHDGEKGTEEQQDDVEEKPETEQVVEDEWQEAYTAKGREKPERSIPVYVAHIITIITHASDLQQHEVDLLNRFFNLANAHHLNGLWKEAIQTYTIVKNKQYAQGGRLRVNMGNIYFEQEQFPTAIRMYRIMRSAWRWTRSPTRARKCSQALRSCTGQEGLAGGLHVGHRRAEAGKPRESSERDGDLQGALVPQGEGVRQGH